jgi:MATE family multidrug resistance protein
VLTSLSSSVSNHDSTASVISAEQLVKQQQQQFMAQQQAALQQQQQQQQNRTRLPSIATNTATAATTTTLVLASTPTSSTTSPRYQLPGGGGGGGASTPTSLLNGSRSNSTASRSVLVPLSDRRVTRLSSADVLVGASPSLSALPLGSPLPPSIALTSIITSGTESISRCDELRLLWRLGWPVGLATMLRAGMLLTDIAVLGHASTEWLAGGSAAMVWMGLTGAFLWRGFGGVLGSLGAQAFGAGVFRLVGIWLQVALLFATLSALLVSVLWVHTEPLLLALGVESSIASLSGTFALWSLAWLPALVWLELLVRYFQSQQVILPALVLHAVFLPINVLLQLLLVHGVPKGSMPSFLSPHLHDNGWDSGLGIKGSPIATAVVRWAMLLCFWTYTCVWKRLHVQTWLAGWNFRRSGALHPARVRHFLRAHALPAFGACLLEELPLAAHLTSSSSASGSSTFAARALGVQHASQELLSFLVAVLLSGPAAAVQIRVSSYLAVRNASSARQVGLLGAQVLVGLGLLAAALLMALRSVVGVVYSNDQALIDLAERCALLLGGCMLALAVLHACVAVLHAQGRSALVAQAFGLGSSLVAVPLAALLSFGPSTHLGLRGLWVGLLTGYVFSASVVLVALLCWTDWQAQAEEALWRAAHRKRAITAGEDDPARKEARGLDEQLKRLQYQQQQQQFGGSDGGMLTGEAPLRRKRRKRRPRNNPMSPVINGVRNASSAAVNGGGPVRLTAGDLEQGPGSEVPSASVSDTDGDFGTDDGLTDYDDDDEYDEFEEEEAWNAEEIAFRAQELEKQRAALIAQQQATAAATIG